MERAKIDLWKIIKENVPFIFSFLALLFTIAAWVSKVDGQDKILSAHTEQIEKVQSDMQGISTTLTVIQNNQERDYQELKELRGDIKQLRNEK